MPCRHGYFCRVHSFRIQNCCLYFRDQITVFLHAFQALPIEFCPREGSVMFSVSLYFFFFLKKIPSKEGTNVESWPRLADESIHCVPRFPSSYSHDRRSGGPPSSERAFIRRRPIMPRQTTHARRARGYTKVRTPRQGD